MRLFGCPIAPVVVGLILGPMAGQQPRRALSISQGDPLAPVVPMLPRRRDRGRLLSQMAADAD